MKEEKHAPPCHTLAAPWKGDQVHFPALGMDQGLSMRAMQAAVSTLTCSSGVTLLGTVSTSYDAIHFYSDP